MAVIHKVFSLWQELEEERRQRGAAVSAKKKMEGEFAELEASIENANKQKDDAQKQFKKIQVCTDLAYLAGLMKTLWFSITFVILTITHISLFIVLTGV